MRQFFYGGLFARTQTNIAQVMDCNGDCERREAAISTGSYSEPLARVLCEIMARQKLQEARGE